MSEGNAEELLYIVEKDYQPEYAPPYGLYKIHCPTILKDSPFWNFSKQTRENYRNERSPWDTTFHPKMIKKIMIDGINEITPEQVIKHWESDSLLRTSPPGLIERVKQGKATWYFGDEKEKPILRLIWKIHRLQAEINFPSGRSFTTIIQLWFKMHQARERALHPRDWMVWSDKRYPSYSGCKSTTEPKMKGASLENEWCFVEKEILGTLKDAIEDIILLNDKAIDERENKEWEERMKQEEIERERLVKEEEEREQFELQMNELKEKEEKEKRKKQKEKQKMKQKQEKEKRKQKILQEEIKSQKAIADANTEALQLQKKMAEYQSQMMILSAQMSANQIDAVTYAKKCEELAKLLK